MAITIPIAGSIHKLGESPGGLRRVRIGVDADDDFRATDRGGHGREVAELRTSLARDDR
jgi:hypothetical protein